jgi:hypothetical protein
MAALTCARRVILSDPVAFGNVHRRDRQPQSRHMDLHMGGNISLVRGLNGFQPDRRLLRDSNVGALLEP